MRLTPLIGKTNPRGGWITEPAAKRKEALKSLVTRYGHRQVWLRLRDDIREIVGAARRPVQRLLDAATERDDGKLRIPMHHGAVRARGEHVSRPEDVFALFPTDEPFAVDVRTALALLNRMPYRQLFEECEAAEAEEEVDEEEVTPAPPPPKRAAPKRGRRTKKPAAD
jgi:hypothetical protein